MGSNSTPTPTPRDITDVVFAMDERLDRAEAEQRRLEDQIRTLSTPLWRNWKALTPVGVIGGVVLGALLWLWTEVPQIAQVVHHKLLRTHSALAMSLEEGRQDTDADQTLNKALKSEFETNLAVDETQAFLTKLAMSKGLRTYSGSHSYKAVSVPLGRISCLLMADSEMRDVFMATSDAAADRIFQLDTSCLSTQKGTELHVTDFSPLYVPFHAKTGDTVELVVRVRANDPNSPTVHEDASSMIEAVVYKGQPVTFERIEDNLVRATLKLPDSLRRHVVSIQLNRKGELLVDPTRSGFSAQANPMVVSLFATIIVTPESES